MLPWALCRPGGSLKNGGSRTMKDLYFSHDRNALNDNKISLMRGSYGMEGYGVYWAIIEALSREPDLCLEYS